MDHLPVSLLLVMNCFESNHRQPGDGLVGRSSLNLG